MFTRDTQELTALPLDDKIERASHNLSQSRFLGSSSAAAL
jgi:hypothetical protein